MFPPFALPSNPAKQAIIREATTAETLDFCDVLVEHEEALTTKFLNAIQDPASYTDSALWSADDRRLGLFWYWIHTVEDTYVDIDFTCPHCKASHNHVFDMRDIASGYQEIKGKAERELTFNARRLLVVPLDGNSMEMLEGMRMGLSVQESGTPQYSRLKADIKFAELQSQISFADDHEKSSHKRLASLNNWLLELTETHFHQLKNKVADLQADMAHGLPSKISDGKIMLQSPKHICPTLKGGKEVTTELLLPFRDYIRIPRI